LRAVERCYQHGGESKSFFPNRIDGLLEEALPSRGWKLRLCACPHRLLGCSTGPWRGGIMPPVGKERGNTLTPYELPCGPSLGLCLNLLVDARDWTFGTCLTAAFCPPILFTKHTSSPEASIARCWFSKWRVPQSRLIGFARECQCTRGFSGAISRFGWISSWHTLDAQTIAVAPSCC